MHFFERWREEFIFELFNDRSKSNCFRRRGVCVYIYIRRKKKKEEGKVSLRRKILTTDHRVEEQGTKSKKQLGLLRNERKRFVNVVDLKDPIWNLSVKREACIVRSRLASSSSKSDGRNSKG